MCLKEIRLHSQILGLTIVTIIGEDLHDHLRRERIVTFTNEDIHTSSENYEENGYRHSLDLVTMSQAKWM